MNPKSTAHTEQLKTTSNKTTKMLQLREYQERFINNISDKLRTHRKVVAQLATGGGKTVCFSAICDRFCAKSSQDILILVHREELLTQATKAINLPTQQVVAGMRSIPPARVYVAMVESAYKRLHQFTNIGMVIVDECHIGNFTKVIDQFKEQYIIGFTATPLAAKKTNPLRNYFSDIVCGIDIPECKSQGPGWARICSAYMVAGGTTAPARDEKPSGDATLSGSGS